MLRGRLSLRHVPPLAIALGVAATTVEWRIAPPFAAMVFTLCAVITGLASVLISRHVIGRLRELGEAMDLARQGELEIRLAPHPVRELDHISRSYNLMAEALVDYTARLEHQAFHDPLTGLPNRAGFLAAFSQALSKSLVTHGSVAVIFLDLDRFKVLNDTLGHPVGDQLLGVVARRLVAAAGSQMVARLGGDEFTLLIESEAPESDAVRIGQRIIETLERPLSVAGHELFVSASVGIAVSGQDGRTITELLRKADIALYRAKAEGRARVVLFQPELDATSAEQLDLDAALRRSIERGELILYFQPIVDLTTGQIAAAEALLRWQHPHHGILSPTTFINIAEDSGEIVRIGQWVLEEACRKAVEFQDANPGLPLSVTVNISTSEFRQPDFAANIARVLAETGLVPSYLKLELTESVLIGDFARTLAVISELKGLGIGLAIDDFGTGYSSLSYLQRLPVDVLKVDQSFIAELGRRPTAGPVLRAIAELGNALFIQVVCEGVETQEQLDFVRSVGCRFGQGHYFYPAMTADEFGEVLKRHSMPKRPKLRRVS